MRARSRGWATAPQAQRALPAVSLLLLFLLASAAHVEGAAAQAGAQPRVIVHSYRHDLGHVLPGETREGVLNFTNPDALPIRLRLATQASGSWISIPDTVEVEAGETASVRYSYAVPASAQPGEHGESIQLGVGAAAAPAEGLGTLVAGTAVLITSRTTTVGVSTLERPDTVLPGEALQGRALVVSAWSENATVLLRTRWGSVENVSGPLPLASGGTSMVEFELKPPAGAEAGEQVLEISLENVDASEAPLSQPPQRSFFLGLRQADYALHGIEDLRDGHARVTVEVHNTGNIPIEISPLVRLRALNGTLLEPVRLDTIVLQPGERRMLSGILAAPPGEFEVLVEQDGNAAQMAPLRATSEKPLQFTMRAPATPAFAWMEEIPWRTIVLGLALGAVLVAAWRGRRRLVAFAVAVQAARVPWARPRATEGEWASAADIDAFLVAMEAPAAVGIAVRGAAREEVVVLLDLPSLRARDGSLPSPRELLVAGAAGRPVAAAIAFDLARDDDASAQRWSDLDDAGFTPRVRIASGSPGDFRVDIALEAARQARSGHTVILATHDAAYAELARQLRAEGARVEVLGFPARIPVALREVATLVREHAAAPIERAHAAGRPRAISKE